MNILEHSIAWAKGEQFEGMCIAIGGLATIVLTFLFWKYGTTPNAKSLVLPSLVLGVLFILMGIAMINSNGKRPVAFQQAYESDSVQFLLDEKKRVEEFQILYPISLGVSAVFFLITLIGFVWTRNPTIHAIGIALSVFGWALIVIDYFSKERAAIYYEQILQQLQ
ncbi:MAG: hypothetical protein JJT94_10370 [Bernardetiaceae bacterium]|nr:hypothetical protein [Bernardetiaceae bacterium]